MASITIRNLDEALIASLRARAEANGRSMEAEARNILELALGSDVPTQEEPFKGFGRTPKTR